MESRPGTFIVLEATDPSQSEAVVARLEQRLQGAGHTVVTYHFPRLHEQSSYFVQKYMADHYGDQPAVSPYTASLLFALDRYDAAPSIRSAIADGAVVLCSNYTGANMAGQATKFASAQERRGFYIWLDNLEFQMLGIPRPDKSLVLASQDKPLDQSTALQLELTQLFPKDFEMIGTSRNGTALTTTQVDELIWQKIVPLLPEPGSAKASAAPAAAPPKSTSRTVSLRELCRDNPTELLRQPLLHDVSSAAFITPSMRKDIIPSYETAMRKLLGQVSDLQRQLMTAISPGEAEKAAADLALRQLLPMALTVSYPSLPQAEDKPLSLDTTSWHADHERPVALIASSPINELEALPLLAFAGANTPYTQLRQDLSQLPVNQKYDQLEQLVTSRHGLDLIHYDIQLIADMISLAQLRSYGAITTYQTLSPRYGFALPTVIEKHDLIEAYEAIFGTSLSLHSLLIKEGETAAAELAVLAGHKTRALVRLTASQLQKLTDQAGTYTSALETAVPIARQLAAERHPIINT